MTLELSNREFVVYALYLLGGATRYQLLEERGVAVSGVIEIEVQRQRLNKTSILRVRDFADGMTDSDMVTKLVAKSSPGRYSGSGRSLKNRRAARDQPTSFNTSASSPTSSGKRMKFGGLGWPPR